MMWSIAVCLGGCAGPEIPPEVECSGQGTFTAKIGTNTYSGQFSVDGMACTVELDGRWAAPVSVAYNGQDYTLTSAGLELVCSPSVFPSDSVWQILPELLRQLWADPAFSEQAGSGWRRTIAVPSGETVLCTGETENIVILLLPEEKGTVTLEYNKMTE